MRIYPTEDLSLTAALICNGHQLEDIVKGPLKAKLLLVNDETLKEDIAAYWNDELDGNLRRHSQVIKELKTRAKNVQNA